ncbi:MAG: tRNA lysidine(34) synthetase TilS [Terracidiphilus sp.]
MADRTPYDFGMRMPLEPSLPMDAKLLKPGLRLAVGVSGGADSAALLCALNARRSALGLVLHAAHLHHGLRGAEADADLEFVRAMAAKLDVPFHEARVDVEGEAEKSRESIEEAARRLRYAWFRQLMAGGEVEAVATAHTRDDQAETVCAKFLRGAWTEGLGGIHPVVVFPEGRVIRPLLAATRSEVEAYLKALGQAWREDSSNQNLTHTRNRIRHELLPLLEEWNPQIREHLAQMSALAREEEAWWQAELARVAPQILLAGRPVRGGGRASGDGLALDVTRFATLHPALQRRLLRHAAQRLKASLDFAATEALRALALDGRAGQKRELAQGLRAERTPRELRLTVQAVSGDAAEAIPEYKAAIPGEIVAPAFGLRLWIEIVGADSRAILVEGGMALREEASADLSSGAEAQAAEKDTVSGGIPEEHTSGAKAHIDLIGFVPGMNPRPTARASFSAGSEAQAYSVDNIYGLKPVPFAPAPFAPARLAGTEAVLRNWRPGDRVRLRYSGGPRKVKEVLERLRVTGSSRMRWPVLEAGGHIVWMMGVELEPEPGIRVVATDL